MARNPEKHAQQKHVARQIADDLATYEALKQLRDAAQRDDADTIRVLLADPEVDVNDPGQAGQTALHIAAANNSVNAMDALIDNGANINAQDINQDTPLSVAVFGDKHDAAGLLLHAGAVIETNDHNGMGPLHIATKRGNGDMVRLLLNGGADPDHRTISSSGHQNADEMAAYYNQDNIVAILKEHRAMVHANRVKSLRRSCSRNLSRGMRP